MTRAWHVQIIAETTSSAGGAYAIHAPPGSYLIYVVDPDGKTLNNDSNSGINGSGADVALQAGVPLERDLVVNRYFRG